MYLGRDWLGAVGEPPNLQFVTGDATRRRSARRPPATRSSCSSSRAARRGCGRSARCRPPAPRCCSRSTTTCTACASRRDHVHRKAFGLEELSSTSAAWRAGDGVICSTEWLARALPPLQPARVGVPQRDRPRPLRPHAPAARRASRSAGRAAPGTAAGARRGCREVADGDGRARPRRASSASASRSRTRSSRASAPTRGAGRSRLRAARHLPGGDDACSTSRSRPPASAASSAARATCAGSRPARSASR